jgi:hypothetical protein
MFLSLPHSLIALVVCLLETGALAQSGSSSSRKAHFGDYVASGVGLSNKPTSTSTTETTTQSASPLPPLTTGTGQEYASSCASALETWSSSSFNWQWKNAQITTSTFSSGFTEELQLPGTTKVTSLVTLCDGHPRVVGYTSVSTPGLSTSTVAWTNTITETNPNFAYPTPPPCSIQPNDCKTLSSSYNVWLSSQLKKYGMATGAGPLCTVTPSSSYSYSTNTRGQTCDNCLIAASTARVMFWPVTTASGGNLCNNTASTITASPTGPPNSFITDGITITSPTVAVSLGFMSRVDGCGTTINHTIIPVHPDQVSSVRGYRALFSHHRFNFADLNYWCGDTNTTNATIAEGQGDSCYQQVPAAAYFGGLNNAVVYAQAPFRNMSKADMTIWDDYQPQLLPPQTMTEAIASLWGDNCYIHPDGVWDPPIALTPEAALIVPTLPSTESGGLESTPASPLNSYGAQPPRQTGIVVPMPPPNDGPNSGKQHFTALPETGGYGGDGGSGSGGGGSSSGQNGGSSENSGDGNTSGGSGGNGQGGQGPSGGSGDNGGSSDGSGSGSSGGSNGNSGSGNNAGSNDNSGSGSNGGSNGNSGSGNNGGSNGNSGSGSNGGLNGNSGSGSNVGSNGNSGSGNNGGSNDNSGFVNGSGQSGTGQSNQGGVVTQVNVHTTVMTVGNKIVQCTQDSNGAWIIPDITTTYTASAGGSAVEFEGATLTAGPNGLVDLDKQHTVLTIGNRVMTGSKDAHGAWVIADASTTHTVSQGGSAVVVDGVAFTAASQGLVKADASETSESNASDGSVNGSGTGTQDSSATQTDRAQQSASVTGSDGAAAASNTDGSSSGAGVSRWSPASIMLALLSIYVCAL